MKALSDFEPLQREFILALCRLNPTDWVKAAEVRNYVEQSSDRGTHFPRSNTRTYIEPLEKAGLIEFESGGTAAGKSIQLRTTPLFNNEILEPFLDATATNLNLDAATTRYFRMQPQDIFADLSSNSKYRKGVALEALAVYVMRLLGLRLRGWRKRAAETGGAEIDALMAGTLGAVATKWQVQCKNTPGSAVRLEDIAKEVGLVGLTGVTHLLFLTTGRYTQDALKYAHRTMQTSSLSIYLMDNKDIDRIQENPSTLANLLMEKSEAIQNQWLNRPAWLDDPMVSAI